MTTNLVIDKEKELNKLLTIINNDNYAYFKEIWEKKRCYCKK